MVIFKKKYFVIIENTKDLDLSNTKISKKFIIIYRNYQNKHDIHKLTIFRRICKTKRIDFYVANNIYLMKLLKADGLYISAHNKRINLNKFKNSNFEILGSAHNIKELNLKNLQGCKTVIFSRLFQTEYKEKNGHLGIIKFNLLARTRKENLIPLGGIRISNLNKMKLLASEGLVLLSEIKKKPAKIISRLF